MCGRFALYATLDEIVSHFHLKSFFLMRPRYNISPTQTIPIICEWGKAIEFAHWGYIPSWVNEVQNTQKAQNTQKGHSNARFETLSEKPSFKTAFQKRRCLIPASGYFEWRTFSGKKQPFFICVKNQPIFAMAGIFSVSTSSLGEFLSCAIITKKSSEALATLHERQPLILTPEQEKRWLGENQPKTEDFLENNQLKYEIRPVTPRMGNPIFEGAECIQSL